MKERPILFNAEMVKAILSGRKMQTRRVIKPQPPSGVRKSVLVKSGVEDGHGRELVCPLGQPGDQLWVRETWSDVNNAGCPSVAYRADGEVRYLGEEDGEEADPNLEKYWFATWYPDLINGTEGRWRPSIHMPRWASRINLLITSVRVERLNSLTNTDAKAEGYPAERKIDGGSTYPWLWFRDLWDGIYPDNTFKVNPWVWVIEFERVAPAGNQP